MASAGKARTLLWKFFRLARVLEKGRPNVFIAGDDAQAKAGVAAFIESIGLRPLDVGGLKMAHWLEGVGGVTVGSPASGWATGTSPSASMNSPAEPRG